MLFFFDSRLLRWFILGFGLVGGGGGPFALYLFLFGLVISISRHALTHPWDRYTSGSCPQNA